MNTFHKFTSGPGPRSPKTTPKNLGPRGPGLVPDSDTPSDQRFYRLVPVVPAWSPTKRPWSALVPPYKGDQRPGPQTGTNSKYQLLADWYASRGYEPAALDELMAAVARAFDEGPAS